MMKKSLLIGAMLTLGATQLEAQCTSAFGQVPNIPANSWGNTVPTDRAVYNDCVTGLVLGMAARPRGTGNPAITDNGISTYYVQAGPDVSTNPPAGTGYATWNFAFYVGGDNKAQYSYKLFFDFDPTAGSPSLSFGLPLLYNPNSWNLGMPNFGPVTFDPNAEGDYAFRLAAYTDDTYANEVASTSMNVVSTVPEPSTYVLMASGLLGLGLASRRRRAARAIA